MERKFPDHLALMGDTEGVVDEEEGETMVRPKGRSAHAGEIMRLWEEGLFVGQISSRLKTTTANVRRVLQSAGISDQDIDARWSFKCKGPSPAAAGETRVTNLPAVAEKDEAREESAPSLPAVTIPWRDLCNQHKCEDCLHHHVCGRVRIIAERPWIACRDWERRAS